MNDEAQNRNELYEVDEDLAGQVQEEVGEEAIVSMYERMMLIRRFEEQAGRAYQMKKIRGFCHLYTGQEAVAVGAVEAIEDRDYVITAYRDHGHALACGMTPQTVMAELYGKATGSSKGKGGSMHLFDVERNFYGGWAIVGGQIPLATGAAFSLDYRDEDAVCLCFFGEGAIHQGVFHESANMAANWDLPIVYIIEDNRYAMGTPLERASAVSDLTKKAESYDMRADTADGQDLFDVYTTVQSAAEHAREESRPTLLHVDTYRYRGHSMTDPVPYRDRDEVEEERHRRDPIQRLSNWLLDREAVTEQQLDEIDERVRETVDEAADAADAADFPEPEEITDDVYVDWPWEIR